MFDILEPFFQHLVRLFPRLWTVKAWEGGIIMRCGKLKRVVGPGLYFLWPIVDIERSTIVQTQTVDVRVQSAITKDQKNITISCAITYKVQNVEKALLKVYDYEVAIAIEALGVLLHYFSKRTFDACFEVDEIVGELQKGLAEQAARSWGLKLERIQLTDLADAKVIRLITDGGERGAVPLEEEE